MRAGRVDGCIGGSGFKWNLLQCFRLPLLSAMGVAFVFAVLAGLAHGRVLDACLSGWSGVGAVNCSGANLSGAVFVDKYMPDSRFDGANLERAAFRGAFVSGSTFDGANMAGADLSGLIGNGVSMRKANLEGADLTQATLDWADMTEATLRGCDMSGGSFVHSELTNADTSGAVKHEAMLGGETFREVGNAAAGDGSTQEEDDSSIGLVSKRAMVVFSTVVLGIASVLFLYKSKLRPIQQECTSSKQTVGLSKVAEEEQPSCKEEYEAETPVTTHSRDCMTPSPEITPVSVLLDNKTDLAIMKKDIVYVAGKKPFSRQRMKSTRIFR